MHLLYQKSIEYVLNLKKKWQKHVGKDLNQHIGSYKDLQVFANLLAAFTIKTQIRVNSKLSKAKQTCRLLDNNFTLPQQDLCQELVICNSHHGQVRIDDSQASILILAVQNTTQQRYLIMLLTVIFLSGTKTDICIYQS